MSAFKVRRALAVIGVLSSMGAGAQAAVEDTEKEARVTPSARDASGVVDADGVAYCGQQDREAPCQPKFARDVDGRIFHVVSSPAVIEALQDGNNLRVHVVGDVVLDAVFLPDRLAVRDFQVLETLQGGVLNTSRNEVSTPDPTERPVPSDVR